MSDSVKKYFEIQEDLGNCSLTTCDCINDEIEKRKQQVKEINVKNFKNVN